MFSWLCAEAQYAPYCYNSFFSGINIFMIEVSSYFRWMRIVLFFCNLLKFFYIVKIVLCMTLENVSLLTLFFMNNSA